MAKRIKIQSATMRKLESKLELLLLCFLLGFCLAMLQNKPVKSWLAKPNDTPVLLQDMAFPPQAKQTAGIVTVTNHADLDQMFAAKDYDLDQVYSGAGAVPPIFLTRLPADLHLIASTDDKKDMFIRAVLPLVLLANDQILDTRVKLIRAWNKQLSGKALSAAELDFIARTAEEYGVDDQNLAVLVNRVDIIPPSLALAQAAEESGWGTSRFAQLGNALFGQQVHFAEGGMMPLAREAGRTHVVKSYENLYGTVLSYGRNLNTHNAYEEFRKIRAEARIKGRAINSMDLAEALTSYSERRADYVRTIKTIISANDLQDLDSARLSVDGSYWRDRLI